MSSEEKNIVYKFPGGMNTDGSGIISELFITINQEVKKEELLAILSSNGFEMEVRAESNGKVIDIIKGINQTLNQNDDMWIIKTGHNNTYK